MRLLIYVVEHLDEEADVCIEGHVELLPLSELLIALQGHSGLVSLTSQYDGRTSLPRRKAQSSRSVGFEPLPEVEDQVYKDQDLGFDGFESSWLLSVLFILDQP